MSTSCSADQLACIAAYYSAAGVSATTQSTGGGLPRDRLPLAWAAASSSARLVAEQRDAWVVLPFPTATTASSEAPDKSPVMLNIFGEALSNATTPITALQAALGTHPAQLASPSANSQTVDRATVLAWPARILLYWGKWAAESLADVDHAAAPEELQAPLLVDAVSNGVNARASSLHGAGSEYQVASHGIQAARCCGLHLGGLTTVLVSGTHLFTGEGTAPAPQKAADLDTLLFPSTTSYGGSVAPVLLVPPNAAPFDDTVTHTSIWSQARLYKTKSDNFLREDAMLHADDGGARDEKSHDPRTATSVYGATQLRQLRLGLQCATASAEALRTLVWYRQVFVDADAATADVLCGVSQWWLQRPIHLHELPTAILSLRRRGLDRVDSTTSTTASASLLLPAPELRVKYLVDIGADLWWPHRIISVIQHRLPSHPWHAQPLAPLRWLAVLWVFISVLIKSVLHGVPEVPAEHSSFHRGVDLVTAFRMMGEVYGRQDQLAALDVSHTAIRGDQLFACAVGTMLSARTRTAASPTGRWEGSGYPLPTSAAPEEWPLSIERGCFRALDVGQCIQLHHRTGELKALHVLFADFQARALELVRRTSTAPGAAENGVLAAPLAVVDALMAFSFADADTAASRSTTGLALALLSHHGSLTWISGAGCNIDNAALRELGRYALLVEAVSATQQRRPLPTSLSSASCAITALDLTSALSLDDVNALAYLPRLEQLLIPFSYVMDDGVDRLDGYTYMQDLGDFLALCPASRIVELDMVVRRVVSSVVERLLQFTSVPAERTRDGAQSQQQGQESHAHHHTKAHQHAVEALHHAFRSHLYHLDLTYCSFVSSANGLARQRRLELLNLSQTRINRPGLFSLLQDRPLAPKQNGASSPVPPTPPLRLFIAEMCEHLNDLAGLAHLTTLECVIVRSGSLGDDGIVELCTADMVHLTLIDFSYCDRLHEVGVLARLPALRHLILDSTDIGPTNVRGLRRSRTLETLSVRFCTEFAVIGADKTELEHVVGSFPRLKNYYYADLIGDDELRVKKTT